MIFKKKTRIGMASQATVAVCEISRSVTNGSYRNEKFLEIPLGASPGLIMMDYYFTILFTLQKEISR